MKVIYKLILRLLLYPSRWRYESYGRCASCGALSVFLYSRELASDLVRQISSWGMSPDFLQMLAERENYLCCNCSANLRKRSIAKTVLDAMEVRDVRELVSSKQINIYETARYNVFYEKQLNRLGSYVVSEYFADKPLGTDVNGVRNENLESLTFPDDYFDVVITSDVLEHVANLDAAISEVKRVLKPGGYHVFTVPVDMQLTNTRARVTADGNELTFLLPPVMHGDTIRDEGILAFRDFGADILSYMSREGFITQEQVYVSPKGVAFSIYYARKQYE